jgi:hypothetical protein
MSEQALDHDEPHKGNIALRLNWLRAGVLGGNDGIVSTAGIVLGVAGATTKSSAILTAGIAGLAAGAMSMAVGEYVSVSSQRDTEKALLEKERGELTETKSSKSSPACMRQKGFPPTWRPRWRNS